MPISTAATVTSASSPAASPPILIGSVELLARTRLFRRADRDFELARGGVDAEPGEPERAAGHALGFHVERTVGDRDRISARAPIGADLERHDIVAFDEIDVDELL